jgi:hypothetical protein
MRADISEVLPTPQLALLVALLDERPRAAALCRLLGDATALASLCRAGLTPLMRHGTGGQPTPGPGRLQLRRTSALASSRARIAKGRERQAVGFS